MGRKGSKLIPFLIEALNGKKYSNLMFEDVVSQTFSLFLPQKSSRLDVDSQLVLQGWYKVKNRPYRMRKDYTEAKQGMEAAMRKSDFLEVVRKGRNTKLIYRILNPSEVRDKKSFKKARKVALKSDPYANSEYAPSPESSGYGSGSEASEEIFEVDDSHASLHAFNHDHEYLKVVDESMQLGCVEAVTDPPPIKKEGLLCDDVFPFDDIAASVPVCQNSFSDLDFSSLQDYGFPDEGDTLPVQDPVTGEMSLNPLFDEDISFISNPEHAKLLDECFEELKEFFPDLEENSVKPNISAASSLDITSYKTKIVKVYECLNRQNLPGMIMLTCEPKLKEFYVSDTKENEPSTSTLIFERETKDLVSKCTIENIQLLPNDHLLMFLKCKGDPYLL